MKCSVLSRQDVGELLNALLLEAVYGTEAGIQSRAVPVDSIAWRDPLSSFLT